jgi:hypothetical protein
MRDVFVLMGVLRSFGRHSDDDTPLIVHIFACPFRNTSVAPTPAKPVDGNILSGPHGVDLRRCVEIGKRPFSWFHRSLTPYSSEEPKLTSVESVDTPTHQRQYSSHLTMPAATSNHMTYDMSLQVGRKFI